MNIKRILLISLIIVAIIASASAVSAGLLDWFGWNNGKITLTHNYTYGYHDIYENGSEETYYYVDTIVVDDVIYDVYENDRGNHQLVPIGCVD